MTVGWAKGRMKWDTSLVAGGTPSTSDESFWLDGDDPTGTPFVAIADMSRRSAVFKTSKALSADGMKSKNMPIGEPGTLLLAMYASVGEVSFLNIHATWNQAILGITPDPDRVDRRFLAYVLLDMRDELLKDVRSNTQSNLNATQVGDLWFQRPPLAEQRQIADYLDRETAQIDTLIEAQQQLVETLSERRKAVVEWELSHVPATSAPCRLKHIVTSVRQGRSPQCHAWPSADANSFGVLKAGAVNGGVFRPGENKELPHEMEADTALSLKQNWLVVSRANTRDLVGSAAVIEQDYPWLLLCDKLYALTIDESAAEPRFIALVLGARKWRGLIESAATGSSYSMQNISRQDILNLPLHLPTLAVQQDLLYRLDAKRDKIDALIMEAQRFIELSRERRSALIAAAVTGQIDVQDEVA